MIHGEARPFCGSRAEAAGPGTLHWAIWSLPCGVKRSCSWWGQLQLLMGSVAVGAAGVYRVEEEDRRRNGVI